MLIPIYIIYFIKFDGRLSIKIPMHTGPQLNS